MIATMDGAARRARGIPPVVLAALLGFCGTAAAEQAFIHPPGAAVAVERTIDSTALSPGQEATIAVTIRNTGSDLLRGLRYCEHWPDGWQLTTKSTGLDGVQIPDLLPQAGPADEIFDGYTPYRWILEAPQDGTTFQPDRPIPAGGSLRIVFSVRPPNVQGSFASDRYTFAGWLPASEIAVLGYAVSPSTVTIGTGGKSFRRSDANTDGAFDISDPIQTLLFLFTGLPSRGCDDAMDSNDDGQVDIADVIHFLSFLFLQTSAPPAPFPDCGKDPKVDAPDCFMYTPCGN